LVAAEIFSAASPRTQELRLLNILFADHPRSLGESYLEHLRHALEFGSAMTGAGIACVIHALVPALFVRTASTTILRLHDRMTAMRRLDHRNL
jgi:Family of unknown function (DUF6356)